MAKATLGKVVPNIKLPATSDQTISLKDYRGQHLILYFYPRDNTPGCTQESQEFRDHYKVFSKHNIALLGVSRDSVKSHEKFKEKHSFPFELLSDEAEELCQAFDVMVMKNMYGKKVRGIERSTFHIDPQGVLTKEWRKVKVDGHVAEIVDYIKGL